MTNKVLLAELTVRIYMDKDKVPDELEHPLFDAIDDLESDIEWFASGELNGFESIDVKVTQ